MLSFHIKFVQTDRQTDRQDGKTDNSKQCAPDYSIQGHKSGKTDVGWTDDRHRKTVRDHNSSLSTLCSGEPKTRRP